MRQTGLLTRPMGCLGSAYLRLTADSWARGCSAGKAVSEDWQT